MVYLRRASRSTRLRNHGGSILITIGDNQVLDLLVRQNIGAQSSGLEGPSLVVLVPSQTLDLLSAVSGYFVNESILGSVQVQSTGLVEGRRVLEGQEVDVGLGEQVCNVLVEVKGELQVQSGLTAGIELIPGSLVFAEVEDYIFRVIAELYNRTYVPTYLYRPPTERFYPDNSTATLSYIHQKQPTPQAWK